MASPWEQDFKDFKPSPPPWLLTGRKATPGVDYYDPRKPYKYWVEKEIRNHDVELQRIIKGKLSDDIKNRRNKPEVKPRSFPWRCKVYRCEPQSNVDWSKHWSRNLEMLYGVTNLLLLSFARR